MEFEIIEFLAGVFTLLYCATVRAYLLCVRVIKYPPLGVSWGRCVSGPAGTRFHNNAVGRPHQRAQLRCKRTPRPVWQNEHGAPEKVGSRVSRLHGCLRRKPRAPGGRSLTITSIIGSGVATEIKKEKK